MDYNMDYLKNKGFFSQHCIDDEVLLTDKSKVVYRFDPSTNLAYFEDFPKDRIVEIVRWLRTRTVHDLYWFWDGSRLYAYREAGENKQFVFNTTKGMPPEYLRGKEKKLGLFSSGNIRILFETRDIVDHFYKRMWDRRLAMARSIKQEMSDRDKLLVAQRFIDRLIFVYFLVEKGIVHLSKGNTNARLLFGRLVSVSNFYGLMCKIFFLFLNTETHDLLEIDEIKGYGLVIPFLNGGLFREREISVKDSTIKESDIVFEDYAWSDLVKELNRYNWLIDDYTVDEPEDTIGNLTPEILGHIYERFVISVSELETVNLSDISTDNRGVLRTGQRKLGAYYTPSHITHYLARKTVIRLISKRTSLSMSDVDPIEALKLLADKDKLVVEKFLSSVKVVDPAVGSGAFLLAIADTLEQFRKVCGNTMNDYKLRRSIIIDNLFGVDKMEGATEICMLRLWLWLAASMAIGNIIEKLPNIDFNIRCGNSLLGITSESLFIDQNELLVSDELRKKFQEYSKELDSYKHEDQTNKVAHLDYLNREMSNQLNRILADALSITVTRHLNSLSDLKEEWTLVDSKSGAGLGEFVIKLPRGFSKRAEEDLKILGFRVGKSQAKKTFNFSNKTQLASLKKAMKLIKGRDKTVILQRPLQSQDLEELKPFHWIMEFPQVFMTGNLFDIVIGNPPHGSQMNVLEKEIYEHIYTMNKGRRDIAKYFTERSFDLTNIILTFVLPKSCTYTTKWEDFRTKLVKERLMGAIDLGVAFRGVKHEQVILEIGPASKFSSYSVGYMKGDSIINLDILPARELQMTIPIHITKQERSLLKRLSKLGHPLLGTFEPRIFRGEGTRITNQGMICIKGDNIERFKIHSTNYRIRKRDVRSQYSDIYKKPRVIAQRLIAHITKPEGHLKIAALYDDKHINFETVINIVPEDERTAKVLVALLNSPIVGWFTYIHLYNRAVRNLDFDKYYIERIPIPKYSKDEAILIQRLSEVCSEAKAREEIPLYKVAKRIVDLLCYELYLRPPLTSSFMKFALLHFNKLLNSSGVNFSRWMNNTLLFVETNKYKEISAAIKSDVGVALVETSYGL